MTEHLKLHPKDYTTLRGLKGMTSKRRRLMCYLRRTNMERYAFVIKTLGLKDVGPELPIPKYNFNPKHPKKNKKK